MNEREPDSRSSTGPALLVDTHVHFHPSFRWTEFLGGAATNFAAGRRTSGLPERSPGCLMLTECAGVHCFRALLDDPGILSHTGWRVEQTEEACSFQLWRDEATPIVVIAGRQIVTSERIEVLALGMIEEVPDNHPIGETLAAVANAEAIAVLPWGFGKWWGRRGRILRGLLADRAPGSFCFGDNGGRAERMPRPGLLKRAEERGFIVLAGSDPLRLASHMTRAGSYGSIVCAWETTTRPMQAIIGRLHAAGRSPPFFGSPSSIPAAVYSQLALRFHRKGR